MIQILPPLPHALSLSPSALLPFSLERECCLFPDKKKEESLLAAILFVLSLTAISSTKTPCFGHYSSSLNFNRQCTTAIFSISSFSFVPRSIQALHYTIPSRIRSSLMALFPNCLVLVVLIVSRGVLVSGASFTFINKCDFTVWPGILVSAGSPKLDSTGFELSKGSSRTFQAPTGWSGRFWGRTGCEFDGSGRGSCATGDCSSGQMECNGAGATPPATLAEFTLGSGSQDFYDVSLVDGYNLPMFVEGSGGSGACASTGCVVDLNRRCPTELRVDGGGACKSACGAFGTDEYCCSGAYNTPAACKPSMYSQLFKSACPQSYSYAYDDATSTFTCTGADYTITFCPSLPSLKSSRDSSPVVTGTTIGGSVSDSGTDSGTIPQATFANSWLANLATGDSIRTRPLAFETAIVLVVSLILSFLHL